MVRFTLGAAGLAALAAVCPPAQVQSVYTELSEAACRIVQVEPETGASVRRCPGVGGFHLLVADDDDRSSVTVVSPDGSEHPLDYWSVVTPAFSSLGPRAEWRVVRRGGRATPVSLIVRVNAFEQGDAGAPQRRSYLAVARISPSPVCVTDRIEPRPNANAEARRAADASSRRRCLQPR